jgi:recombinational DNA repair protein (RecF pathway)
MSNYIKYLFSKEFFFTCLVSTGVAIALSSCGEPAPTPDTCAGIYDNGQPCSQEYDPHWVPDPEQGEATSTLSTGQY